MLTGLLQCIQCSGLSGCFLSNSSTVSSSDYSQWLKRQSYTHTNARNSGLFSLVLVRATEDFHQANKKVPVRHLPQFSPCYTQGAATLGFQQARKMSVSFDLSDVFARMLEVKGDNQIISGGGQ